jgi:hypothetical protein
MAIVLALPVCAYTASGSAWMARQGAATPGVYQTEKSSKPRIAHRGSVCSLPR